MLSSFVDGVGGRFLPTGTFCLLSYWMLSRSDTPVIDRLPEDCAILSNWLTLGVTGETFCPELLVGGSGGCLTTIGFGSTGCGTGTGSGLLSSTMS